jgi:hypothetical protein
MEHEPKPALQDGEYVINPNGFANGGIVKDTGNQPIIDTSGCEYLIPFDTLDCPYCRNPEGWDACPVHRDGVPPTPTTPSQ